MTQYDTVSLSNADSTQKRGHNDDAGEDKSSERTSQENKLIEQRVKEQKKETDAARSIQSSNNPVVRSARTPVRMVGAAPLVAEPDAMSGACISNILLGPYVF